MKQSFKCRRFDDLNREGKYRLSQFCSDLLARDFPRNFNGNGREKRSMLL